MQVYRLDDRTEAAGFARNAVVSKIPNLLSKSRQLIMSKQFGKSFSFNQNDSLDESLLNEPNGDEERSKTIHLSSIIFTPTDSVTTISEMKRKIQNYTLTRCRGGNLLVANQPDSDRAENDRFSLETIKIAGRKVWLVSLYEINSRLIFENHQMTSWMSRTNWPGTVGSRDCCRQKRWRSTRRTSAATRSRRRSRATTVSSSTGWAR